MIDYENAIKLYLLMFLWGVLAILGAWKAIEIIIWLATHIEVV